MSESPHPLPTLICFLRLHDESEADAEALQLMPRRGNVDASLNSKHRLDASIR